MDLDSPTLETNMTVDEAWETLNLIDQVYQNVHDLDSLESLCEDPKLPETATEAQKDLAKRIFGAEASRCVGRDSYDCSHWQPSESWPGHLDQEDTLMLLVAMDELTRNISTIKEYHDLRQPDVLEQKLNAVYVGGGQHTKPQLELAGKIMERVEAERLQAEAAGFLEPKNLHMAGLRGGHPGVKRHFGMFTTHFPSWYEAERRAS
jgi:hypothetical protein